MGLTKEQEEILIKFGRRLISRMKDAPWRYQKLVDDHFWDLLYEAKKEKKESP